MMVTAWAARCDQLVDFTLSPHVYAPGRLSRMRTGGPPATWPAAPSVDCLRIGTLLPGLYQSLDVPAFTAFHAASSSLRRLRSCDGKQFPISDIHDNIVGTGEFQKQSIVPPVSGTYPILPDCIGGPLMTNLLPSR